MSLGEGCLLPDSSASQDRFFRCTDLPMLVRAADHLLSGDHSLRWLTCLFCSSGGLCWRLVTTASHNLGADLTSTDAYGLDRMLCLDEGIGKLQDIITVPCNTGGELDRVRAKAEK